MRVLTTSIILPPMINDLTALRYWAYKNAWSMDQLPGMKRGLAAAKIENIAPIKKMVGPLAPSKYQSSVSTTTSEVRTVIVAILSFLIGMLFATYGSGLVDDIRSLNSEHGMPSIHDQIS